MSGHPLRYYQQDLVTGIKQAWSDGARVVLGVSATGSGKTVVVSHLMAQEPGGSLFMAHRSELVSQASIALAREGLVHRVIGPDSLRRNCAAIHVAEFGRSFYDPNSRTAVAGVDTLIRVPSNAAWLSNIALWVVDEGHHLLSDNKWGDAVALMPQARGLAVTATPLRADGRGLGRHADGLADAMVVGPPMRQLINEGWLTKYRVFAPPSDLDLSAVKVTDSGDFSPEPLRKAVHKSRITGDVVAHYLRIARGKLGMTFCVDIEAATETAEAFRAAGVAAEVIHGKTPELVRARIMREFRQRRVMQLVSVDILGEGTDVPAVEVVSMARPTQSYGLFVQQFGRALRLMDGKEFALIIDHVGNVFRHGLPDAPRDWSLNRRDRRTKGPSDAIPTRLCLRDECGSVYERTLPECPYCGQPAPPPAARSTPAMVDGDLCELDESVLAALRGEISKVDDAPAFPYGAGPAVVGHIRRNHWERQQAQKPLREAIMWWGGIQAAKGLDERAQQRAFFFRFGIDVGTAQTLPAADAKQLLDRVMRDF